MRKAARFRDKMLKKNHFNKWLKVISKNRNLEDKIKKFIYF